MIDRSQYDNIPIPQQLPQVVDQAIAQGLGRKRRHWAGKLACALALVLLTGSVTLLNLSPAFAAAAQDVPVLGDLCRFLVFREYHWSDPVKYVNVVIPQIDNTGKSELEQQVNGYIQTLMENCVAESTQRAQEYYQAFVDTGGDPADFLPVGITVDYQVKYLSPRYASFVIRHMESAFSAYQNDYYYTLDLEAGRMLTLRDWLGEDYRQIATRSIQATIDGWDDSQKAMLWEDLRVENLIGESTSFYLNGEGQPVVVFEKYLAACGAAGALEFPITLP